MSCREAPVARQCYSDAVRNYGHKVSFLGIIGDQAHAVRQSGHNCPPMAELSCSPQGYAHAVDIGVDGSVTGYSIVNTLLKDPRVHYMIYKGIGYRPYHRGGGTFSSSGHDTHVHVSFGCGTTHDTRPFFGIKKPLTAGQRRQYMNKARAAAEKKKVLAPGERGMSRRDIILVQRTVKHPPTGVYGPGTQRAVSDFRKFWKIKDEHGKYPPKVNRRTWTMILFLNLLKFLGY